MAGKMDGAVCAKRPCTCCGRNVWVLLATGTCAPCRGYGDYDDDDTEENAMTGIQRTELTDALRLTLLTERSNYQSALLRLTPVLVENDATRAACQQYLTEVSARWGQLDSMEHESEGLSWEAVKKSREFFLPLKTTLGELQNMLREKLGGVRPSSPPPAFDAADGWTYTVKDLGIVPIAGHVLNQKWVRSEVARQLAEAPTMPPDVPGLRFSRVSK